MNQGLLFALIALIVGFVTAGLSIKFDRFFVMILLVSFLKKSIFSTIDIFLWVLLFGALYLIIANIQMFKVMPKKEIIKRFTIIPLLTITASYFGSYYYFLASAKIMIVFLGAIALLYGLRLVFIHFKESEMGYSNEKPGFLVVCMVFGPLISGFSEGFIGTSLKSVKIPVGVKLGKMNIKQVYMGNALSAAFAAVFSLIFHNTLFVKSETHGFNDFLFGAALWTVVTFVFKFTELFFKDKWRKVFQIIIGIILTAVAFKFIL